jgi:hypothetical protein
MRRIKLAVVVVAAMVAMMAGSAIPAVADNNDGIFRFDDNRDNNNNIFGFDANDLFNLGCLGAVIDGQCFGITTFDGNVFDNNGDFNTSDNNGFSMGIGG